MKPQVTAKQASAARARRQIFRGRHLVNQRATGPGSAKQTHHHEIALDAAPVAFRPGDALGVYPTNDPVLVDRIIRAIGAQGDEPVTRAGEPTTTLADALTSRCSLAAPTRRLIELIVARGADDLAPLLAPANADRLKRYLSGPAAPDILDLIETHRSVTVLPAEVVDTLRSSPPRLYSIASSQVAWPGEVHLLVISMRATIRGRVRLGVGSTWFNDRWPIGATADMYLQDQQTHFAMPADPATPMIMIGPGTGVAPFRAFMQERQATGASGRNWLFFGEQHRVTEFYYEADLSAWARDGFLRLDTAFSRDQSEKIYVQHRMRERAREFWAWLEDGAEIFVCGDKAHMAADVDRELHHIVETAGGKTPEQAIEYVAALRKSKRYKRDVY